MDLATCPSGLSCTAARAANAMAKRNNRKAELSAQLSPWQACHGVGLTKRATLLDLELFEAPCAQRPHAVSA